MVSALNPFFLSSIVAFSMTLTMAGIMLSKRSLGPATYRFGWFLVCVSIGISGDFIFSEPFRIFPPTIFLVKLTQLAGFFMPPLLLDSILNFLNIQRFRRHLLSWYLVSFVCVLMSLFSDLLIAKIEISDWSISFVGGPLFQFFTIQIGISLLLTLGFSIYRIFFESDLKKRANIKLLIYAYAFISMASIVYFVGIMGFAFPRVDNLFLAVFVLIIAYAITKHELMDIKLVVNKVGALLVAIGIFISGYLVWAIPYRSYISSQIDLDFLILSCIYLVVIVGLYFQRVQRFLQVTQQIFCKNDSIGSKS